MSSISTGNASRTKQIIASLSAVGLLGAGYLTYKEFFSNSEGKLSYAQADGTNQVGRGVEQAGGNAGQIINENIGAAKSSQSGKVYRVPAQIGESPSTLDGAAALPPSPLGPQTKPSPRQALLNEVNDGVASAGSLANYRGQDPRTELKANIAVLFELDRIISNDIANDPPILNSLGNALLTQENPFISKDNVMQAMGKLQTVLKAEGQGIDPEVLGNFVKTFLLFHGYDMVNGNGQHAPTSYDTELAASYEVLRASLLPKVNEQAVNLVKEN